MQPAGQQVCHIGKPQQKTLAVIVEPAQTAVHGGAVAFDVTDDLRGRRHRRCSAVLTDLGVAGGLVHHQVEGLQRTKGQEQVLDLQQRRRGRSAGMCMAELLTTCSLGRSKSRT